MGSGTPVTAVVDDLCDLLGGDAVVAGSVAGDAYSHDEALTVPPVAPLAVVRPSCTVDVAATLRLADEHRVPVVARGSGTGLSGGCVPAPGGIVVSFERMDRIVEIDTANHVAVVQPGVTLAQLDAELAPLDLVYPIAPGEQSASLGGNVATNAGGMQAIRYGVTRHRVLGLEAVLAGGEVIRTGGRFVKSSSGYDLTQLLVGSEGTLALFTEVTVRLEPRPHHRATVLAPFATLASVTRAVPALVAAGLAPLVLEYLDRLTMASVTESAGIELGIPDHVRDAAFAYLVVVLAGTHAGRVEEDVEALGQRLDDLDALDVYVLPEQAGADLVAARERAFFAAKAAGADDIVDTVVPRAAVPTFLAAVGELALEHGARIAGCGHVGDGNVHLSVFQPDPGRRRALLRAIFRTGIDLGGAVSGEHGIGTAKREYFTELADPAALALMAGVKAVFDPHGIMGPGRLLPPPDAGGRDGAPSP